MVPPPLCPEQIVAFTTTRPIVAGCTTNFFVFNPRASLVFPPIPLRNGIPLFQLRLFSAPRSNEP